MSEKFKRSEAKKVLLDEKQGLLNFVPEEMKKEPEDQKEIVVPEIERISCQYCQDVGFCKFCERGRIAEKERIAANAHKHLRNDSNYRKRRWKFKTK
ncbi:MAG: hypothetical protein HY226_03600 [Candidatus Vogelbacteria bacterium]|nr:hypothetical protein [Candidatus Vogelbacteria bacterium]